MVLIYGRDVSKRGQVNDLKLEQKLYYYLAQREVLMINYE